MPNGADVVAAGAIVTRHGGREVLIVHRPKYDDWSFPKGKQEPGEHVTVTAVREVLEETGVEIRLGRPLMPQLYSIAGGRTKQVNYWAGRVLGDDDLSGYAANHEIDDLAWVPAKKALDRLSYVDDIELLSQFDEVRKRTETLVVVRHGRAHDRKTWAGDDDERPLTEAGHEQADAIAPVLHAYGVSRVLSSPSLRCTQTVAPYAEMQVLDLEEYDGLSEELATDATIDELVDDVLGRRESAVICSHRPVLPALLERLGVREEPLAPAEMVVCHHRKGRIVNVERHLVR